MIKKRKAFSLIEVVFVLVILGIIASIGSSIIVQVYESYVIQRAVYNAGTKTELVANQIVNRLSYRIHGTTISKDHSVFKANPNAKPIEGTNWAELKDITGSNFTTIEWIGADNDTFCATTVPMWSSLANYANSEIHGVASPATDKDNLGDVIKYLSNNEVKFTSSRPAAILFQDTNNEYAEGLEYSPSCMGLINNGDNSCIFPVYKATDTKTFRFTASHVSTPKKITERYKLAWSAYAIALEPNNSGLNNLFLYSNYQPWNVSGADTEDYINNGTKHKLLTDVSSFTFSEIGDTIRFKLCVRERINSEDNVTICKEKAILP